jgi:hypothetical protein
LKVKVVDRLQVAHDGVVYPAGSTAEVPDEIAVHWLRSGWVTEAPAVTRKGTASK